MQATDPSPHSYLHHCSQFTIKWAPRVFVATLAGYYGLGIAYASGLMAEIDRIAIKILRHFYGYLGIGAVMPIFQWYAAWAMRISIGLVAGLAYDLIERVVRYTASYFPFLNAYIQNQSTPPPSLAQTYTQ